MGSQSGRAVDAIWNTVCRVAASDEIASTPYSPPVLKLRRAASTISRELRRNAATRGGGLAYRATTAQWHAERSARRPKQAKLALNAALRTYVEERLGGAVIAPSGAAVPGPAVHWKGRRHGPRQHRRWANAWRARNKLLAACRSTSRMMRPCASAMKLYIRRCLFKVVARCAAS